MSHDAPESYGRLLANLLSILVALAVVGYVALAPRPPQPAPAIAAAPAPAPAKTSVVVAPRPKVKAKRAVAAEPPKLDRAALAQAEGDLDAASRDRARAEARADAAQRALSDALAQAQLDEARGKKLALRVRDPSAQLALVSSQGGFLKAERDRLKDEVAALRAAPRPKAKVLADTTPVARPPGGDEYHFELRRNRITYIDLERLLELVKADAQVRIRGDDGSRVIESKVGPVGAFSLEYAMARSLPSIGELMQRRGLFYDLRGWELVPEFEGRGETYEVTKSPVSEYARAINRLNPARATITMWIYPDGFALYRTLRDELHARGYLVAARPLPETMAIRGSPSGSISAGQ